MVSAAAALRVLPSTAWVVVVLVAAAWGHALAALTVDLAAVGLVVGVLVSPTLALAVSALTAEQAVAGALVGPTPTLAAGVGAVVDLPLLLAVGGVAPQKQGPIRPL